MLYLLVNTIAAAKPDRAKMVENMLIQMAQTGQISKLHLLAVYVMLFSKVES